MSTIKISREHPFSLDEARSRVDQLREGLKTKLGIDAKWQGDELHIDGKGAKGQVLVTEQNVDVQLKLNFLLSAMAPKIEEKIQEGLDKAIKQA